MQTARAVGRFAASRKYDVITAMGVYALAGDPRRQSLTLRFVTLLTARYNWQKNELSMGRVEMARLWSVTERTVKRELARLKAMGWLTVKRTGARGRVTVYAADIEQILIDTREVWPIIGPDFVERMTPETPVAPEESKVVAFPNPAAPQAPEDDLWSGVSDILRNRHAHLYAAWFRLLAPLEREGGAVTLTAPSKFVADYVSAQLLPHLLAAYARCDGSVRQIRIEVAG